MGVVTRAKMRRMVEEEEEEEHLHDRISALPDGVRSAIVSCFLPTKDGARTQVLSSRWRYMWFPKEFRGGCWFPRGQRPPPPPPLAPLLRRSELASTIGAASFGGCAFPEIDDAGAGALHLHLPALKQLSLLQATISETSLHALLAGCPALQSLLLVHIVGCSCLRVVSSSSLRSIAVHPGSRMRQWLWLDDCAVYPVKTRPLLQHLVLEDAPNLERLHLFSYGDDTLVDISVISAPKLEILGALSDNFSTSFEGPRLFRFTTVVPRIKILALVNTTLCLDAVMNFLECFPCLEKLYIKTTLGGSTNEWGDEYRNRLVDIRVKKVVLLNYAGDKSHVNFAKFFVLHAGMLESMVFELEDTTMMHSTEWIEEQRELLHTKNRASSGARFDFVPHQYGRRGFMNKAQMHDLSTADPFVRFREWFS